MNMGSNLHISTDVIAKIARIAAMEIDGVEDIVSSGSGVKGLLGRAGAQKPIQVKMSDGIAEITIELVVSYGTKIKTMCEKVHENVKSAVQSMTGIAVSRVNIVVGGIAQPQPEEPAAEQDDRSE